MKLFNIERRNTMPHFNYPSDILSILDIAQMLQVHPQTMELRLREGKFPAPDYGGQGRGKKRFWTLETVDEWIRGQGW